MNIVAAFDKTLFHDESTKFTVMRMKTADMMIPDDAREPFRYADHLVRFTAVGYNLPRTDAVKIELEGAWTDSKYGRRFQVESWREIVPPTIEGIQGYLSSGLLKCIGPKTAEAIVQQFGTDSLNILENQPEKLLKIKGITEERLEEIKAGYAESTLLRDLLTLLAPFKITPSTAMKIYEHFGAGGVELLRESFYRLCEVSGFGFERVDAIVRKSGGDLRDPKRIQGALLYTLEQSRSNGGHLYLEAEKLVANSLQLLNEKILQPNLRLNQQQVVHELEEMVKTNVVVCVQGNIYLPGVYAQEGNTASKIASMLLEKPEPVRLASVMEYVRSQMSITLSPKQAEGIEMVFRHNLSIITGGPGTGKSTILKAVIAVYQKLYPRNTIQLGAPTGKASRRMAETTGIEDAQTLHSLLKLRGDDVGRQERELEADFLIVDEASMMDMWLAHQLFSQLRVGTKVLLVGDADQLESVGAGNVFRELIGCGLIPVTVLDQIFRQAEDSLIAYNAKFINEGNADLYYGRDFQFIPAGDQEEAAELIRCFYMEEAAAGGIDQIQILSPFRSRGAASSNELNEIIREEINPPAGDKPEVHAGGRTYRLGDRVMQVKNDYDIILLDQNGKEAAKGVFNGESGTVCKVQPDAVTVAFDGRYANYPLESLDELELSYAMTIHKSQGSEYRTVLIPMLTAHSILLSRNLLYTAITRAKRRVLLVGQKKALYIAARKCKSDKRNTLLGARIRSDYHAMTQNKAPAA